MSVIVNMFSYQQINSAFLLIAGVPSLKDKSHSLYTESNAKLTGIEIDHFCVKLLTSMDCNGLNWKW